MTGSTSPRPGPPGPARSPYDYEDIAPDYYDAVYARGRGIQSKWHHLKFRAVRRCLPEHGRLLDLGCGPGTFLRTLPARLRGTGLDVAQGQLRHARQHAPAHGPGFVRSSALCLPFADHTFDVVTAIEILEHFPPDAARAVLAEACRVLRPGGRLVLTTPNYRSLWPVLEQIVNRLGPVSYQDQHLTRFTRPRLRRLLADAGLTRIDIRPILCTAPFAAAVHWGLADRLDALESRLPLPGLGFLLLATGVKSHAP